MLKLSNRSKRWWGADLKDKLKRYRNVRRQTKKDRHPEMQVKAKECGEEFVKVTTAAKRKCWNDSLSLKNSTNIWDVLSFVKSAKPNTVVSKLTRRDETNAETLRKVANCFFEELFLPAPGDGSVNLCLRKTVDGLN
jgi:hypothetical protein